MAIKIRDEILDELMKGYRKPEDLLGSDGIFKELQKRLLERAMSAELTVHLGYEKHEAIGRNSGNSRNGSTPKTLKGEFGSMPLEVPRDRNGTFEPVIVGKGQRRFEGFDQAIISLYSRGLTTREIEGHLREIYGVDVSPGLISEVTEAVQADVLVWQNRALEEVYPIVYFDALWSKVRENGQTQKVAVYLVLGITMEGKKDLLGMWAAETEGAKFWMQIMNDLQMRGVKDMFIACVDGLKGFPRRWRRCFRERRCSCAWCIWCVIH